MDASKNPIPQKPTAQFPDRDVQLAGSSWRIGDALFLISPTDLPCGGMVSVVCFKPTGKPVAISGLEDVPLLNACLGVVHHLETSTADLLA
ncbi:hypothetical protein OL239_11220 [Arthrobacter sp. ATA002]|uniref:hypothetical protein n=1 Tax=Arthrobacter sp. ATA002 TaxID=2991715 RepID=UPI0022A6CA6D|nr:hypothetical protein [Arthrobacter sp. ATA002]WAP50603.1 hypothetical protein OL239_11220 [Arthrobacter sp. ATA002]